MGETTSNMRAWKDEFHKRLCALETEIAELSKAVARIERLVSILWEKE